MMDMIRHALGRPTSEDKRILSENTPGTWDYARAVEAAMQAAGYDDARKLALRGGLVGPHPLNIYRNASGWQVQEWYPPYDCPGVPIAEWQPDATV